MTSIHPVLSSLFSRYRKAARLPCQGKDPSGWRNFSVPHGGSVMRVAIQMWLRDWIEKLREVHVASIWQLSGQPESDTVSFVVSMDLIGLHIREFVKLIHTLGCQAK